MIIWQGRGGLTALFIILSMAGVIGLEVRNRVSQVAMLATPGQAATLAAKAATATISAARVHAYLRGAATDGTARRG